MGDRFEEFCRKSGGACGAGTLVTAVGPDRDMDHGMIERQRMEAELGAKKRNDFHLREQAVSMHQRSLVRRFFAMNGNVAHFHLHVERNNMEAADSARPPVMRSISATSRLRT